MQTKTLCPHLAPVINKLVSSGASFTSVSPGNEDIKFIHALNKGPTPSFATKLAVDHGVEYWVSNDPHYDRESGFSCGSCRLAVSWLQKNGVINAT